MTKKDPESKNVKFEEALKRLEKIVEKLEAGDVPLEESIALYEEGISLFRQCSSKLEEAKKKVEILAKDASTGRMKTEPFSLGRGNGGAKPPSEDVSAGEGEPEEIPF
ncbi:MAG: exodeoxyribonuclease VII small subunit [Elusimicrobia bacterium RIFCSPLOWO2_01_FULL_64_13]|nr:MAG: exodeoxyribonuclease VII small subunit [Elusimicrobia bacterium RIFCSPHIGHO2_01_FULL_64_10]OGR95781.1 MAG: exodeoxyribonuclease VII small subunit [Elusimicrobia bacterium RIFCSPLOWO2_01_FULL_64_13]